MKSTIGATAVAVVLAFPGAAWAGQRRVTDTVTVQTTTVQSTVVTAPASTAPTTATGTGVPETTVVQTTTVFASPPAKTRPTKCPPGSTDPNLCETVPSHPHAKHRKRKPPNSPTVSSGPSPTSATTLPAGPSLPTLSSTLSGLAAKAVNSLIDLFPVPPFLLPIYQEAGDLYDVPWPVLAAINEIETDFGRNLSVSSAGAVGWMQFMPSTWMKYGLDADGRGTANPYDPIDAIFAAARYLHAAGATRNLRRAIFAYNHAGWYVNSVVLRAALLRYLPQSVIDALTGLMQASFPVAGHLGRSAGQPPVLVRVGRQSGVVLRAPAGAPVIAVADGRVVAIGRDAQRGWYVTIVDSYGNRFTYSHLGSVENVYPMVKPRAEPAARVVGEAGLRLALVGGAVARTTTGSVGSRAGSPTAASGSAGEGATARAVTPVDFPVVQQPAMVKERLFANPLRPASYAAGGRVQLQSSVSSYALATWLQVGGRGPVDYYSEPLHLRPRQFDLAPLRPGVTVVAGTVLGRVGRPANGRPDIVFQVRPAGAKAPVDPTSIIAGWELLGRLTAGRSALIGAGESGAYGTRNLTLGQLLLATKPALERAVLTDRRVTIYPCGRHDIETGAVDRRVLAAIEYLSYSGLAPDVSGLVCGQPAGVAAQPGTDLQISALDGVPVAGHQQAGGVVDLAIRALMQLQGSLRPDQIISLRSYPWQSGAIALPDHADRLEIDFSSPSLAGSGVGAESLSSAEWGQLIKRLSQLAGQPGEPTPFEPLPASTQ